MGECPLLSSDLLIPPTFSPFFLNIDSLLSKLNPIFKMPFSSQTGTQPALKVFRKSPFNQVSKSLTEKPDVLPANLKTIRIYFPPSNWFQKLEIYISASNLFASVTSGCIKLNPNWFCFLKIGIFPCQRLALGHTLPKSIH